MKEKSFFKGLSKKVLSLFLVLCIFVNGLPAGRVFADGEQEKSSGNAFEALGIDNKKKPEGYQQHARNPYGKDVVSSNPVQELYIAGLGNAVGETDVSEDKASNVEDNASVLKKLEEKYSEALPENAFQAKTFSNTVPSTYSYTLYGDGIHKSNGEALASEQKKTIQYQAKMENIHLAVKNASGNDAGKTYLKDLHRQAGNQQIAISAMAAGTFDNSRIDTKKENEKNAFRKSQVAIVYASELDKNGGLYLKVRDVLTGEESAPIELMDSQAIIGNPDLKNDRGLPYENFQLAPYLLQNYLKVTTGDYDGDGVDEIAVYVPKKGDSKIVVYKLGKTSGDGDTAFLDAEKWKRDWTYSLKETSYTSNMVSLTSGDFNRDGMDDLAGAWGYYYGPQENKGSTAVVMFGDANHRLQKSRQFDLNYHGSDLVRGAFIYGDFFSKGNNMLIFGGQSDADLKAGNTYTRYVCAYVWDGNKFVAKTQKNFDLFAKDGDGKLLYPAMKLAGTPDGAGKPEEDSKATFLSMPLAPVNMAVVAQGTPTQNQKSPSKLYLDSLLIGGLEDGFIIQKRLDRERYDSGQEFVEYQAVSGDLTGDGESALAVVRQKLVQTDIKNVQRTVQGENIQVPRYEEKVYYKNWFHRLIGKKSRRKVLVGYDTVNQVQHIEQPVNYISEMPKVDVWVLDRQGKKVQTWDNYDLSTTLCTTNTDLDTTFMKYTGKHFFTYSDPKVLAVLASPPYFQDLKRDDLSGSYGESETSYASSSGSGSSQTKSTSIRAGAYFGFEHEAQAFGIPIATVEFETEIGVEMTMESEKTQMQEQTITYGTVAGSDTVVLYSMPIEVYEFEAYRPNERGEYQNFKMVRNIPHPASIRTMELDRYQDIQKDFEGVLPDISENVLTHELGKPETYPKKLPKVGGSVGKVIAYKGDPTSVGFSASGAFITQEIAMSEENSDCYEIAQSFDFKIGGGLSGFKAGVTVGATGAKGSATITTSGSSFSGTMRAMPIEAENFGYGHLWKIFSYQYNGNGMSFPVVNYMVTNVTQPASLPTDFEQDVKGTAHDRAVLTWTYDKPVAGFQLYSYNQYPDGAGLDELAFVPFSDGVDENGTTRFKYTVENLNPYSDYQFKIQTVQFALPAKSIPSETLSVRTKTKNGYPDIQIWDVSEDQPITDGTMTLYPDAGFNIKALVKNPENYKGINYQWQKKDENGQWKDLPGKTDVAFAASTAGYGDQGKYRCRVNLRYFDPSAQKEFYISAYSEELTAKYKKRPVGFGSKGLFAQSYTNGGKQGVTATAELISASKDHYAAPTGEVQFRLTGVNVSEEKTASLKKGNTPQNGKNVAETAVSFDNLKDGVYEVSVSYLGDNIFSAKDMNEKKIVVVGNGTGKIAYLKCGDQKRETFEYGEAIRAEVYEVTNTGETLSAENYQYTLYQYGNYSDWKKKNGQRTQISLKEFNIWEFGVADQTSGYYLLEVKNGSWKNELPFLVNPKNITLRAEDKTAAQGNVSNIPLTFVVEPTGASVGSDNFSNDVRYTLYDSSGKEVTNFGDQTDPGKYRIVPFVKQDSPYHKKYNFSYKEGVFTLLGASYRVELRAEKLGNLIAGKIKAEEFDGMSGTVIAGTPLHFMAMPYSGYEVKEWAVYENGNFDQAVNTQTGGNNFTHMLKSAKTDVVVRFQKVGYTIAIHQPKKGGDIRNLDGIEFADGVPSSVGKGASFRFQAVSKEGYFFKRWAITPNTTDVIAEMSEDKVTVTAAKTNIQIRAEFVREQYTLNLGEHIGAYYMYDDDNDSSSPKVKKELFSGDSISKDEDVFCYLIAGYEREEGAKWKIDDVEQEDDPTLNGELKIAADSVSGSAVTVTLLSKNQRLKIDTAVKRIENGEEIEDAECGKINVTIDGVLVSDPQELENVKGSGKVVFEVQAAHGYTFSHWIVNDVKKDDSPTFTVERLAENMTVFAVMKPEEAYSVTVTVDPEEKANPIYTLSNRYGEVVEEKELTGQPVKVYKGDSLKVDLCLNSYAMVQQWQVNGEVLENVGAEYTFRNIQENIHATVYLGAITEHEITIKTEGVKNQEKLTATVGTKPLFDGTDEKIVTVDGGSRILFKAEGLEDNRCITEWRVNGKTVTPHSGEQFEFFVNKNATIKACFGDLITHELILPSGLDEFAEINIDATPELMSDGRIRDGAALVLTITPKEGYVIRETDVALETGSFDKLEQQDGKWIASLNSVTDDVKLLVSAHRKVKIGKKESDGTVTWMSTDRLRYTGGIVQFLVGNESAVSCVEEEEVTVNVFSDSGYQFEKLRIYKETGGEEVVFTKTSTGYTFTAPKDNVIVDAVFRYTYIPPTPPIPPTYPITVIGGTASPTKAAKGTMVRIAANFLGVGVRFKEWRIDSGNIILANPKSESTTFEMPNSAVRITATYESIVPPTPTTYPITVIGGTANRTRASKGTTVRITADLLGVGVRFKEWRVDSGNITLVNPKSESTTFEMPNSAVRITATYESIVPPTPEERVDLEEIRKNAHIMPEKMTNDPKKEWTITLNMDLAAVNSKEIRLLDEKGVVLKAAVQFDLSNPRQIRIIPEKEYVSGKRYYVYIQKEGLVSNTGKKLKKDVLFSFIFKE